MDLEKTLGTLNRIQHFNPPPKAPTKKTYVLLDNLKISPNKPVDVSNVLILVYKDYLNTFWSHSCEDAVYFNKDSKGRCTLTPEGTPEATPEGIFETFKLNHQVIMDNLPNYMAKNGIPDHRHIDPLLFWKSMSCPPYVTDVVRALFSFMPTSTNSERSFKLMKFIVRIDYNLSKKTLFFRHFIASNLDLLSSMRDFKVFKEYLQKRIIIYATQQDAFFEDDDVLKPVEYLPAAASTFLTPQSPSPTSNARPQKKKKKN